MIRRILPVFFVLPVFSCLQFPPIVFPEKEPIILDNTQIVQPEVIVPEVHEISGMEQETQESIVLFPEDFLVSPAQNEVQRVQPVFHEPPIRRPENQTPENLIAFAIPERPIIPYPPERPIIPPIPEYILGQGLITDEDLAAFLLYHNPDIMDFAFDLAELYVEEAAEEGINHDIAFAQMCLETGYLKFGGLVTPEMNNFCGLGSTGPGVPGLSFPDPRTGVRAHMQHLKAYATNEPPNLDLVNPRYFLVNFGSSPKINGLAGTWAEDTLYAVKINNILERLYQFTFITGYASLE